MSTNEGKGSILFKLLIVILAVVLVLVINIPGKIWQEEEHELITERTNLTSIYEAERFYHVLTNQYTDDPQELLNVLNGDSTLQIENAVVNNTRMLKLRIRNFLNNPIAKNILIINQAMYDIVSDLQSNRRFFKDDKYESIRNEAEELLTRVSNLRTASSYSNFIFCSLYLDSLNQLNRDITEYSLQVGCTMALFYADTVTNVLGNIDFKGLKGDWQPLSTRLDNLIKSIIRSDLTKLTSVGDRIKDFKQKVDKAFFDIDGVSISDEAAKARTSVADMESLQQDFLKNYIITSKPALVRMPDADSLVLYLTQDKFVSPINKQPIKILFNQDSSAVKVESPVLLDELKAKAAPDAERIGQLKFIRAVKEYTDTLAAIEQKALAIRRALRRNTEVFIGYKTIQEIIKNQIPNLQIYTSYSNLYETSESIPVSQSYSEISGDLEKSLGALNIVKQLLEKNIYGNLDTLHLQLIQKIQEFNETLAGVRRLPEDVKPLDREPELLDDLLQAIKNSGGDDQIAEITDLEQLIGEHLEFANTGIEESVYGVFSKKIINPGFVYQDEKSWEKEE